MLGAYLITVKTIRWNNFIETHREGLIFFRDFFVVLSNYFFCVELWQ